MKFTVDLSELTVDRVYKYEAKVWTADEIFGERSFYIGYVNGMTQRETNRKAKKMAKAFLKSRPGLIKTYSLEIS